MAQQRQLRYMLRHMSSSLCCGTGVSGCLQHQNSWQCILSQGICCSKQHLLHKTVQVHRIVHRQPDWQHVRKLALMLVVHTNVRISNRHVQRDVVMVPINNVQLQQQPLTSAFQACVPAERAMQTL